MTLNTLNSFCLMFIVRDDYIPGRSYSTTLHIMTSFTGFIWYQIWHFDWRKIGVGLFFIKFNYTVYLRFRIIFSSWVNMAADTIHLTMTGSLQRIILRFHLMTGGAELLTRSGFYSY